MLPLPYLAGAAGLLVLTLSTATYVQTQRLDACKARAETAELEHLTQLRTVADLSRENALLAEREALVARLAQLETDRRRGEVAAREAELRRRQAEGLLADLQKDLDNEARNSPDSCVGSPISAGTAQRLRDLEAAYRSD